MPLVELFLSALKGLISRLLEKGRPTRKLLALRAWGATSTADAKKKAAALSARIKNMKS